MQVTTFLHSRVSRAAATLRAFPVDILWRALDVASFTVYTILSVYNQITVTRLVVGHVFVNTSRTKNFDQLKFRKFFYKLPESSLWAIKYVEVPSIIIIFKRQVSGLISVMICSRKGYWREKIKRKFSVRFGIVDFWVIFSRLHFVMVGATMW